MSRARRYDLARERMEAILREEPIPELPWEDIEQRLLARIDAPARPSKPRIPTWFERALPLAAAAAAIALAVRTGGDSGASAEAAPRAHVVDLAAIARVDGAAGELDLRALRPGDVIESSDAAVSFLDQGSVRWTLAPASRAFVRTAGARGIGHVIRLDRGSLRAEVIPRDPAEGLVETFAVEVGGTRVAVHGTIFSVTSFEDRVEVDVERGTVAIGSAAYAGATTGHILVGPARAAFSLDGGRIARFLPPAGAPAAPWPAASLAMGAHVDARVALPAAAGASPASDLPARAALPTDAAPPPGARPSAVESPQAAAPAAISADAPEPAAPAPPAPAAALTQGAVRAALEQCIAAKEQDRLSPVKTSIVSTLRVSVRADGSVAGIRFVPPLKPELQACAESLYAGRFDPPAAGSPVEMTIPLRIER